MKLVMTLLVRNEEDVLRPMLETHFALGVDHVIATDNLSTDGTVRILEHYRRQGRLTLIHEHSDDYDQSAWVTRMARMAAVDHAADWVINADADEFWMPRDGDLRSAFASVPAEFGRLQCWRSNFVTRPEDGRPFLERMRWRRTDSLTHDGAEMSPKVAHRASPNVTVAMGNHDVAGVDGGALDDGSVLVLHFPLRSFAQYEQKIALGTQAVERNERHDSTTSFHWRRSDSLRKAGELGAAWREWMHDDERLAADLASKTVVEDTRVLDIASASRRSRWTRLFRQRSSRAGG